MLGGPLIGDLFFPGYKGTKQCFPTIHFPIEWHITCSENHWSNETTMKAYIEKILLMQPTERGKYSSCSQTILHWWFDNFTGQGMDTIVKPFDDNNIPAVMVPANCMGWLTSFLKKSVNSMSGIQNKFVPLFKFSTENMCMRVCCCKVYIQKWAWHRNKYFCKVFVSDQSVKIWDHDNCVPRIH